MIPTMILLGVMGLIACIVQFALGKWLSKRVLGESITLGQSLGQKNSTIAIWLAQSYLNPLSSVAMAAYSIWQNLLNAYQDVYKRQAVELHPARPSSLAARGAAPRSKGVRHSCAK